LRPQPQVLVRVLPSGVAADVPLLARADKIIEAESSPAAKRVAEVAMPPF